MTDTGDVRDCNRDVPCNEFGPCIVHDPAPEGILDNPKPAPEGEGRLELPEIYRSCAHPQSVWFDEHWRPIFEQMRKERDEANAKLASTARHAMQSSDTEREYSAHLEKERDKLQRERDELDRTASGLIDSNYKLIRERRKLQREVRDLNDCIFQLISDRAICKAELAAARAEIESLRQQITGAPSGRAMDSKSVNTGSTPVAPATPIDEIFRKMLDHEESFTLQDGFVLRDEILRLRREKT